MNDVAPSPAPSIRTRHDLQALLENIAELQRERDELRRAQENELAAVRQRHRAPLAELETFLQLETGWAEAWARAHPEALAADRSLTFAQVTIGFRAESPRIERASRRWTWSRIAQTLGEVAWGKRYLRTPAPEVDQAALTADLAKLSPEELRAVGMVVVQGDQFYITPHSDASGETEWQAAA
jgi:phage host-nuclease inhibitor protein Gam